MQSPEDNHHHHHNSGHEGSSKGTTTADDHTVPENTAAAAQSVKIEEPTTKDEVDRQKKASLGSSLARNASLRIKKVSQKATLLASLTRHRPAKSASAARALNGLRFISKTEGGAAWAKVEARFDQLTSATDGLLPRSLFRECIGN